jgi:uncharacterized protein YndB with AHSA1/START domain
MTKPDYDKVDPRYDLVLERNVDVPPELVWQAWTTPEHIKKWFAPLPWTTPYCEIDLRPGGYNRITMRSPEGKDFPNEGCYLELIENRKIVFTNTLVGGYRPAPDMGAAGLPFTGVLTFEPHGTGTKYTARAMHRDEAGRKAHDEMGFHHGWGQCLDQLVALMKKE